MRDERKLITFNSKKGSLTYLIVFIILIFIFSFSLSFLFFQTIITPSRTEGTSMFPVIQDGDTILINNLDKNFKIGDIITFKSPIFDDMVTHRIVNVTNEGYITKGDNNEREDYFVVNKEQIKGKVVRIIHTGVK